MRLVWLAAAGFHAWLIARRLVSGEWHSLADIVKAALCFGGVWYASLKFWQVSTVFDSRPRRALAFFLIVALGHGFCKSPAAENASPGSPFHIAALAVLPALGLGAAVALAAGIRRRLSRALRPALAARLPRIAIFSGPFPIFPGFFPLLFRRPPPAAA